MKRVKLKDRELPVYTRGEDIFNMVSHIVGGGLGLIALMTCVLIAAVHDNNWGVLSGLIYGLTMILLYTMSSIYHGLRNPTTAKKIFQIIDHCSVYLLIAGSYTPFALCTFREYDSALGWGLFALIWCMAIIGIVLKSIDLRRFRVIGMICYIVMGWCVIFAFPVLVNLMEFPGLLLLVSGGVAYTVGVIFFGLGIKHKYMHSIFHLFIVLGSLLHFMCIVMYVM